MVGKIINYTKKEIEALTTIEEKYRPELGKYNKELNNIDFETNPDEYLEVTNKLTEINEKVMAEREVYYKRAELRTFNKFKGNIDPIVAAVKNQVLTFIYTSKVFAGAMPDVIDSEKMEQHKEDVRQAIISNEKLIEIRPNDEELKKATQELRELKVESLYDSVYSPKSLRERIKESFKIYFDFLLKSDPKAYENLQIYIEDAIKNKDNITLESEKKSEHKNLIPLKSVIPNIFVIPNSKMSNQMTNDLLSVGEVPLIVIKGKNEVVTTVSVNYDDEGIQIYNKQKFTPYDRVVCNSVTSLSEAGNNEFTPLMVYRCMNGLTNNEKVSPQAIGAVTKSIDKISRMSCKIDWTVEAKRRKANVDETIISGNILATEKVTVKSGGKTVDAYTLLSSPILYRYAQSINQVISVPIKLLQTKEATRSTEDVIIVREYLIRRIETMKNPKNNMSNRICYESIYEDLGLLDPTKEKSKKIRDAVNDLLNYWKGENYIKDFLEYKLGKKIEGIDIFY